MLRQEVAQERLEKQRIKNWEKGRLRAIGALPAKLREAGYALLGRDSAGKTFRDWTKRNAAVEKASTTLEKASAGDRLRLFGAFFPKLASHIEGGWQLLTRLPYEAGYERRGFRAPTEPGLARNARQQWLAQLISCLTNYDPDIAWVAAWAPYVSNYYSADALGTLLAAALDAGGPEGEQVFEILKASATNEHEIGSMGEHVTRALLVASRPDGWEFVEKLLLAAQRQEGLRQVILEAIDEAHPEAFRRMLRLILEKDLIRFSATVRAVDVWFGLQWESATPSVIKKALQHVLRFLEDPAARDDTIKSASDEPLYLALWTLGFTDAVAAVGPAGALLKDPKVERRFLAAHFLDQLDLPAARKELGKAIDDEDLRIALRAYEALKELGDNAGVDLFELTEKMIPRLPERGAELPALIWPWATTSADRQDMTANLIHLLGKRPATVLLPYLTSMTGYGRGQVVRQLAEMKNPTPQVRDTLLSLVGDRDSWVRSSAQEAVKKYDISEDEAKRLEAFLTRKGSSTRQAILALLKKQKLAAAQASADRLLASKNGQQRLGGLELMRLLVESKKGVADCRQKAEAYRSARKELTEDEQLHVEAILDIKREVPTLDNALGLMDPSQRSKPTPPTAKKVVLLTPAAVGILEALDALVGEQKEVTVKLPGDESQQEHLFGNLNSWSLPDPNVAEPAEQDVARFVLREVWEKWYASRPKKLSDKDGLELLRAYIWRNHDPAGWKRQVKAAGAKWRPYLTAVAGELAPPKLKEGDKVGWVLTWLLRLHPPEGVRDFLLDAVETGYAAVPADARARVVNTDDWQKRQQDWRYNNPLVVDIDQCEHLAGLVPGAWSPEQQVRLWHLLHWRDQPAPGVARLRPGLDHLLTGFAAGAANETDVFDQLIGPKLDSFSDLSRLTGRWGEDDRQRCPAVVPLVDRIRNRVLELELKRGELPTAASGPAHAIQSLYGTDTLFRLLAALGKKAFARHTYGQGRVEVLTHLIQVTHPAEGDTPEAFAKRVKEAEVPQDKLLALAFMAPQWLGFVEHTVGWPGLREGVYWFLAHMPGGRTDIDEEVEEVEETPPGAQVEHVDPWERIIRERTPLTVEERNEGAVDVDWFHRAHGGLGPRRWNALAEASKYGCSDNSFKKAARLAEVLLGKASKRELVSGVKDKKLKESVRLLGLLPLPDGARREDELLSRYKVLQEYRRYARSLGPMSRESSVRTAEIGLENLARTAGYPDPIRLEWAMEARDVADLAAGPVSVTHEGVTVILSLTEQAQPNLEVKRGDKVLKAVPTKVRKHPKISALTERKAELKRQASRVKQSLERAMVRGDTFTGTELKQLFGHALLTPLLSRLVLLGEGVRGYPVEGGQALRDHAGKVEPVKAEEKLRIAHPYDLYSAGDWDRWQHDCFASERVQPFKQVFRELYLLTEQERTDREQSSRYAGHQVNPSQAMALFGSRGWSTTDGVEKTFYDANLVAHVHFRHHGWTPAQVEGLMLDTLHFTRRGEWEHLPLDQVPPRLFSEVMRDLDLVVSVAHLGGVDPEASASTVEMRTMLLRETCSLLGISNYRVQGHHVLIDGTLGKYSLHLGSGVVHRLPGGSLCIVPVHAAHRGRLFLPFADEDPRTAEVLSKMLLLVRDNEIQDPTILNQLR